MNATPGIVAAVIADLMRRRPPSSPADAAYQGWLTKYGIREDPTYDTRGAFAAGIKPDQRGHLTDEFKLPTHPTFSIESRYNGHEGKVGGEWADLGRGKWAFHASPWNVANTPKPQLMDYFDRVEPGNTISFPDGTTYVGGSR